MTLRPLDAIAASLDNISTSAISGKYPLRLNYPGYESNLFGSGVVVDIGQDKVLSSTPRERDFSTLTPKSAVLIKKKEFSSFKGNNNIQWLDRTEKMLLRATKALMAYKVAQIRAYESITKIETMFQNTSQISLNLLVELYNNAKFLSVDPEILDKSEKSIWRAFDHVIDSIGKSVIDYDYDEIKKDILLILERNTFASDLDLTTWIVDPNSPDNYGTGPGTGVIELGIYSSFDTSVDLNINPNSASLTIEDPYRITLVTEEDIEVAIEEAVVGTIGLLKSLSDPAAPPIDTRSIVSAGLETLGLGFLDPEIDVDYIRNRLRTFNLGRPFINPGDGIHFYIRGNKSVENFNKNSQKFDKDYLAIDETVLEAERILFTNKRIDLESYKRLRQYSDQSFGMHHVYGGYITESSESWNGGKWSLRVSCTDNMGWLDWSRFMEQPAMEDSQGILEDPLTPYEIKKDSTYSIIGNEGPKLLEENKRLINSGLLTFDSGILNGQFASEGNLLQGQYNQSGSISGTKVLQHPSGLVYRWKEGIYAATAALNVSDPTSESAVNQNVHSKNYGVGIAQDVLNNLDIANILSILIVGQPYNVETFINQAYEVHNISKKSNNLQPSDPLSAVIDVIRKQNNRFGDFRPYRMITMSSESILQTANNSIIRTQVNEKIVQLRRRLVDIDIMIEKLTGGTRFKNENGTEGEITIASSTDSLVLTLQREKENIENGIREQLKELSKSGSISSKDIVTANYNLFGRNKALPLTGNYTADHQVSRAMSLVGAQRRIEDVRLNRDKNLFIVSDQYDDQTDIRPFLFKLRGSDYRIFKGEFTSVYKKCEEAAAFLNLELFCNTQGHLEFRPPQWNRTPLSVIQRLFEVNKQSGKRVVPEFLTEVFQSRSASLRREIHKLNIRIVILCLLLNRYPDRSLIPNFNANLKSAAAQQLPNPENGRAVESRVDDADLYGRASLRFFGVNLDGGEPEDKGSADLRIRTSALKARGTSLGIKLGKDGDLLNGDTTTLLGIFDPVFQEVVNLTNNVLTVARTGSKSGALDVATPENLNSLRESFVKISGMDPASDLVSNNGRFDITDFIFEQDKKSSNPQNDSINKASGYLKSLQNTISQRDNLVSILRRNKEKEAELDEIENILSGEFISQFNYLRIFQNEEKRLSDTSVYTAADIGKIVYQIDRNLEFELISINPTRWREARENSFKKTKYLQDLLNRTSAVTKTITDIFTGDATKGSLFDHLIEDDSRNLIGPGSGKRYVIDDLDIVSCTFTERPPGACRVDFTGDAPIVGDSQNNATDNTYYWAGVTDFDLWRQYGYRHGGYKSLPFSNDAENVTKPYAITDIQLERLKINSGTVNIVGNEYYEPGDVVFIKSKQLLYYVRSVDHNYNVGESFSTTLTLEFGHPPGTYLPSPLDIIGQQYSKNPLQGNILTYRNSQGDDNYRILKPDSALLFPPNINIRSGNIASFLDYRDNASRFYNIMTELKTILIGNRLVLLRGFLTEDTPEAEQDIFQKLAAVKSLLTQPVMLSRGKTNLANPGGLSIPGFGGTVGSDKDTSPMRLPNGDVVSPVPRDKIAEQVVYLKKSGSPGKSTVRSFSPEVISKKYLDGREITVDVYASSFPKGGPKQGTWLDIKNDSGSFFSLTTRTLNVSNIIEIGILNIERALESEIEKISQDSKINTSTIEGEGEDEEG